ncbi:hypothetical protein PSEUDO8Z_80006 [Pseudomonas sp. 8Z]|nr:hypothetical protein PSEUDO8Z_80006 [Pseudomonas sp. 8Z]
MFGLSEYFFMRRRMSRIFNSYAWFLNFAPELTLRTRLFTLVRQVSAKQTSQYQQGC